MKSPLASSIRSFAQTQNHTMFLATTSGVFKSSDKGIRWESSGLEGKIIDKIIVTASGSLLAGVYRSGLYRSEDNGESWTSLGFDRNVYLYSILQSEDKMLFLTATFISEGSPGNIPTGVFKSSDDGRTWQQTSFIKPDVINLSQPKKGLLIVSTKTQTYLSKNDGQSWTLGGAGLPNSIPLSKVICFNNSLYASVGDRQEETGELRGGIFRSSDEGLNWVRSDNGIDLRSPISDLCHVKETLYASAGFEQKNGYVGLYKSADQGKTWSKYALGDKISRFVTSMSNGQIVVGTNGEALYISNRDNDNFTQAGAGIDNWETFRITGDNHDLFASGNGIWKYSFTGKAWNLIRKSSSTDIAVTPNGRLLIFENDRILASEDKGKNWHEMKNISGDLAIFKVLSEKLIVAGVTNNGSWYSKNQGLTWEKYKFQGYENPSMRTVGLTSQGTLLLSGTNGSPLTFRSINDGETFDKINGLDSLEVWDFATINDVIYAGTYAYGVFKSKDDGLTWSASNDGLRTDKEYVTVSSFTIIDERTILCSTLGKGLFISKDSGASWHAYNDGITNENLWTSFYDHKSGLIFSASPSGIYNNKFR